MGQKIHPEGFRVGYIHDWKSNWFDERNFADLLLEDMAIREHIESKLSHAGLSDITIVKQRGEITVDIHTARPGIVIGKSGAEVDALRRDLHQITGKPVKVNIREIKRPELDAKLVAQSIAEQLQNRVAFRRAMKRALTSAMRSGAKGVKVQVSGRLGGAEMARTEGYSDGRVPLHTLRADIDYGFVEAQDDHRPDRRQVLDQQGRGDARGLPRRRRRGGARAALVPPPRRPRRGGQQRRRPASRRAPRRARPAGGRPRRPGAAPQQTSPAARPGAASAARPPARGPAGPGGRARAPAAPAQPAAPASRPPAAAAGPAAAARSRRRRPQPAPPQGGVRRAESAPGGDA